MGKATYSSKEEDFISRMGVRIASKDHIIHEDYKGNILYAFDFDSGWILDFVTHDTVKASEAKGTHLGPLPADEVLKFTENMLNSKNTLYVERSKYGEDIWSMNSVGNEYVIGTQDYPELLCIPFDKLEEVVNGIKAMVQF